MNEDVEMVDFQLGNFVINIDSKTARNLCEDPKLARRYHDELCRQCPEAEAGTSTSTSSVSAPGVTATSQLAVNEKSEQRIWTTSKGQTPRDLQATAFFLSLRKDLDEKFRDKKTTNTTLWLEIAEKMNRNGYFVGYGSDGRERCRQKFANLQQTYLKYIDRRRQTGEGKIEKPPFFDEVDIILGKSDKTDPVLILDSIPSSSLDQKTGSSQEPMSNESESTSSNQKGTLGDSIEYNKFINAKKTLKPKKNDFYEKFYNLSERAEERKQKQFQDLVEIMKDESQKRHDKIMQILRVMDQRKTKKRKHDSSSSSD